MQRITPCLWFNDNAETALTCRMMKAILGMKNIDVATLTRVGR